MKVVAECARACAEFNDAWSAFRAGLELSCDPSGVPQNGINHAQILAASNGTRIFWSQVVQDFGFDDTF
jgi:hypothetical protein